MAGSTSTDEEELSDGDLVSIDPEYGFHLSVDRIEGRTVFVSFVDVEGKERTMAFPREALRRVTTTRVL